MHTSFRKVLSLLLALVMCISLLPAAALAEEAEEVSAVEAEGEISVETLVAEETATEEPAQEPAENVPAEEETAVSTETEPAEEPAPAEEIPAAEEPAPADVPVAEEQETQPEEPSASVEEPAPAEDQPAEEEPVPTVPEEPTEEPAEEPAVETVITVEKQPEDARPVEGEVTFRVVASVNTDTALSYSWQRLDESMTYLYPADREAAWKDIEGKTESELRLTGLDNEEALAEAMKYAYRCVLTVGELSALTGEVHVLQPELTEQPGEEETPAVEAADGTVASGNCGANGNNLTWTLDDAGTLTISGTGAMMNYSSSSAVPWYSYKGGVVTAVIEDGATSIGSYAFYNCSSLTSVTIPSSVTSIGNYAFQYCSSLTSVTIPVSVTSIGNYAFQYCSSLTDVYYGSTETIWNGISIGSYNQPLTSATFHCAEAANAIVASGNCGENGDNLTWTLDDTGTLTISGTGAMADCSSPSSVPWCNYRRVVLTAVIEGGVTSIGMYAFYDCISLTSVTIPAGVASIGSYAFQSCSKLTSVTIPAGITSIGSYAFYGCSSLTEVTIPAGVASVGSYAFQHCSNLTSVTIPISVTSIGSGAFFNCTGLADVYYESTEVFWNGISIGSYNEPLTSATIHCAEPTNAIVASGNCGANGNNLTWTLNDAGTLTISGTGAMMNYSGSPAPWYSYKGGVVTASIEDGATSIGAYAFSGCTSLMNVTIPSGVTNIGERAFENCSSLRSVALPDTLSSIAYCTFLYCSSLANVTIPASVTSIGTCAFEYCSSLTSVTIPSGVTSIGEDAFRYCSSLTSVTIPETVSNISRSAFYGCNWLTSAGPIGSGSSIEFGWTAGIPGNAFYGCSSLTSVTIPSGMTSIDYRAFFGCSGLTNVTIPASVTNIGNQTFSGCSSLTDVYFGSTETIWNGISIGSGNDNLTSATIHCTEPSNAIIASGDCGAQGNNLTWTLDDTGTLAISGTGAMANYGNAPWYSYRNSILTVTMEQGIRSIGNSAFSGCSNLSGVTIPSTVRSLGESAFNECSSLTGIELPSGLITMGSSAFSDCSSLTSITIPYGVTSIGYSAFYNCSSLSNVTIPSGVTSIGGEAFSGCNSLTSVTIPSGVTSIGYNAFYNCSNLSSVTIPSTVTSIGSQAFSGCSNLTSAGPIGSGSSIEFAWTESIPESAFYNCDSLTSVMIPPGVKTIGNNAFYSCSNLANVSLSTGLTGIAAGAFQSCNKLTNLVIPSGVANIGYSAFSDCTGLREVILPSTVTSIGSSAFYNCTNLESIVLPSGLTGISGSTFSNCSALSSVAIPVSTVSVGQGAFSMCVSLDDVYYQGREEEWNRINIDNGNEYLTYAELHCQSDLWGEEFYQITLHANGGYFNGNTGTTQIVCSARAGHPVSNASNLDIGHTDAHYIASGWSLNADGSGESIDLSTYVPEGDTTLYVKWVQGNIVTLNANGGYFNGDSNVTQITRTIMPGNQVGYVSIYNANNDLRCNYWTESSDGSGTPINLWDYILSGDITLYARWDRKCTITINANGGYFSGGDTERTAEGTTRNEFYPDNWWTPYHSNPRMALEGWYYDAECTELAASARGSFIPDGDVTIYAHWVEGYIVTLKANGGYFNGDVTIVERTVTVLPGSAVNYGVNAQHPDEQMIFSHWSLNADGSGSQINLWRYVPSGDVTIYAVWARSVRVTLMANGGSFSNGSGEYTADVPSGSEFYPLGWVSVYHNDPQMALEGWYYNAACTEPAVGTGENLRVTEDVTLYAHWVEGYIITLNANGGYFSGNQSMTELTVTVAPGKTIQNNYDPRQSDEHMVCRSWSLNADGSGSQISSLWSYVPTGNVTLYAVWTRTIIITMHANGGYFENWGGAETARVNVTAGQYFSPEQWWLPTHSDPHMAIEGWYYDADCTDLALRPGEGIRPTEDITIYAKWAQGYIVTLKANGGYFNGNPGLTERTVAVMPGNAVQRNYTPQNSDEHLICRNWSLNADGSGTQIDLWNYIPTGDVTLYAVWTRSVIITMHANGGYFENGGGAETATASIAPGEYFRPEQWWLPTHSDPHMAIEGWYYDAACTQLALRPGESICPTEDKTIYAKWVQGYIVTLKANGGYFNGNVTVVERTFTVAPGSSFSYGYSLQHTDEHMICRSWSLNADGSGTKINLWNYIPTGDVTLYAVWTRSVIITMHANGGYFESWNGAETATANISAGDYFSPENWWLPTHSDPRMAIEGWYYDADCTDLAFRPGESICPTEDITIYVKWAQGYIVTLDANGGYFNNDPSLTRLTFTALYGKQFLYTFGVYHSNTILGVSGWYRSSDCSGEPVDLETLVLTEDMTLYAKWEERVIVTFHANGGRFIYNGNTRDYLRYMCSKGAEQEAEYFCELLVTDDREFLGWYYDQKCTVLAAAPGGKITINDNTTEFYAGWSAAEGYTVTVDANGGIIGNNLNPVMSFFILKGHSTGVYFNISHEQGLQLAGWCLNPQGAGRTYDLTTYVPTGNVTLYAKWVVNTDYSLNKTNLNLFVNKTDVLKVTDAGGSSVNVTWVSSKPEVARVSPLGLVTALKNGTATISAKDAEGNEIARCFVRVLFSDVADSTRYFYQPVYWALDNAITTGAGGVGKFSPDANCTREQIVTFLWRLMGEPEPSYYTPFTDVKSTDWYYKPISWAAEMGITVGLNDGTGRFGVGQACTRAMCVTFLWRAAGKPQPKTNGGFTDMKPGAYYVDAVSWAAENKITVGLNDGTGRFGINNACTRAMIVTFLYRFAHMN